MKYVSYSHLFIIQYGCKATGQSRMEQDTELRQTKHKNKQTKQITHTTRPLPKTEGLP
jgi:hypothetical protein